MQEIAVIGGAGFIGTRLCELLEKDQVCSYSIYDKKQSARFPDQSVSVNVNDLQKLTKDLAGSDVVVNLAAEHHDNVSPVSLYYDVNVEGAKNVCDACEVNGINTIIFTSSVAVYGLNKANPNEEHPIDPFNHYGKSKWQAEEVYTSWQQEDPENRRLVIVRPTVVFGEANRGNVYNLLKQVSSGRFLRIGSGTNKKSMAYVGNISSFLKHNIEATDPGIHIYNYVDDPDISMNELVSICESALNKKVPKVRIPYFIGIMGGTTFDVFAKITGRQFPISAVRVKKFCATTQFDASKAHSSGFQPPFTLKEGLTRTLLAEF